MKETMKAVGIYDKEIFLVKIENGKPVNNFDVLRLVTKDQLESLRDPDDEDTRYNYKDLWKMAVAAGHYEGSLDDYIEEAFDEYDLDDDKEMWPGKDESGLENLTAEEREAADKFIEERYGIEVGTWECSGSYAPHARNLPQRRVVFRLPRIRFRLRRKARQEGLRHAPQIKPFQALSYKGWTVPPFLRLSG